MFGFTQIFLQCRMNFLLFSQNNKKLPKIWEKINSSWKTYVNVIRRLRVKEEVKIRERNSKQGFFIIL